MLRAGGGTNADEVLAKLFFGEERICQNFGSFVFEFGVDNTEKGLTIFV